MFDIGFIEMLVIGLILLLVVGPERLPEVARTVGGWVHEAKRYLDGMKSELDRDLQLSELERETRESFERTRSSLDDLDRETRESTDLSGESLEGGAQGAADPEAQREERSVVMEDSDPSTESGDSEVPGANTGASAEGPDPESQAAEDMEQELKQDDQPEEDKNRG